MITSLGVSSNAPPRRARPARSFQPALPARHPMPVAFRPLLAFATAALAVAAPLRAQQPLPDLRSEATAGSEAERYLRVLQVAGAAPLYPWSLRAFSPAELDRLASGTAAHPWAPRFAS